MSWAPLGFVVLLGMMREGLSDYKRYLQDKATNNRGCLVLQGTEFVKRKWKEVKVGDIVKIEEGHMISSDMVLLWSSEKNGRAFIQTANLDGE